MQKIIVIASSICLVLLLVAGLPQWSGGAEIYGCVAKKNGALRIVSDVSQCKPKETGISWNQAGPQGPEGAQGPDGPEGQAGVTNGISRVVIGTVGGAGNIMSGTGFQVSKDTSTHGVYHINFTPDFNAPPICLCTAGGIGEMVNNAVVYAVCGIEAFWPPFSEQIAILRYPANGSTSDWNFRFICAEP